MSKTKRYDEGSEGFEDPFDESKSSRRKDKTVVTVIPPYDNLTDNYMWYRKLPPNPDEETIPAQIWDNLVKCVQIGKELMPKNLDDKEEQQRIDKVYENACKALVSAVPQKKEMDYGYADFGDSRPPVVIIKSDDQGKHKALEANFDAALQSFERGQYLQHLPELMKIDNQIFSILVKYEKLPMRKTRVSDLVDICMSKVKEDMLNKDYIKTMFEQMKRDIDEGGG